MGRTGRALLPAQADSVEQAFATLHVGVSVWDAQARLLVANQRFLEIFSLSPGSVPSRTSLYDFVHQACDTGALEGRDPGEFLSVFNDLATRNATAGWSDQWSDGRVVALEYHPSEAGCWIATCEDITERQRVQDQLLFLAQHDSLTKLANRDHFTQCLGKSLMRGHMASVLCIDFDRFKDVNDTLGHQVGDKLLRLAGWRLRTVFRQSDTVGRLGGDEFAVILAGNKGLDQALACGVSVTELLAQPFDIDGQPIRISASIGVAVGPSHGMDAGTLLTHAELALYAAKAEGAGSMLLFRQQMADRMNARRRLEADLRVALERDEFIVFYQPIVDASSGSVVSFEALIRWNHPVRGMISPADFIPIAEATGMIIPIGGWILRRACVDAALWPAHIKVAVNLSGAQFRAGNLCREVTDALAAAGLDPARLELEITESLLIKDASAARRMLGSLREIGVRVAIDDFGTGYSSLSYLRDFVFDKIKIDKSFVDDLGNGRRSDAVIRTVTRLALDLGVDTVAEGVETDEQRQQLCADGCSHLQGYFFSRPTAVDRVPGIIRDLAATRYVSDLPALGATSIIVP
jgi:diguanylate cyclase (GGDEF)-like protein